MCSSDLTKHGFLVREGDALERLAGVKVIAFDKTGTLTYGAPEVVAAVSVREEIPDEELYRLAASAEQMSEHPLGKAIVSCGKKAGIRPAAAAMWSSIPPWKRTASVAGSTSASGTMYPMSGTGKR